jgi:hypothetical protein
MNLITFYVITFRLRGITRVVCHYKVFNKHLENNNPAHPTISPTSPFLSWSLRLQLQLERERERMQLFLSTLYTDSYTRGDSSV